jgi:hypothetical protein
LCPVRFPRCEFDVVDEFLYPFGGCSPRREHGAECRVAETSAFSDQAAKTIRLGSRPYPVPLDPASRQVLQLRLAYREAQRTGNPHVIVTKGTKAGAPASAAYASHALDGYGVPPRALRCTRLASLVNTINPKLVAAAFGTNPEGVMFYLAGHVDEGHLTGAQGATP